AKPPSRTGEACPLLEKYAERRAQPSGCVIVVHQSAKLASDEPPRLVKICRREGVERDIGEARGLPTVAWIEFGDPARSPGLAVAPAEPIQGVAGLAQRDVQPARLMPPGGPARKLGVVPRTDPAREVSPLGNGEQGPRTQSPGERGGQALHLAEQCLA